MLKYIQFTLKFFLKSGGGGKCITVPPSDSWGPWPPGPPCGGPHVLLLCKIGESHISYTQTLDIE